MARYKRETLEAKTVKELRQLVVKLGIPGQTKKPKDIIINAIMDKYGAAGGGSASVAPASAAPASLTGIEGSFQSSVTKPGEPFGFKTTTNIQISCGANTGRFPVAGHSVAEVGELMREVLNVTKLSTGLVNGKEVEGNYILKEGDVLEFLKPAGKKG
jgi:hypothetical protein